ncbi:MAG: hypothetical protein LR011_11310 [Verrucomicrobia bacterium]|nr:hypothetical protein [Verrucomicrobiota bacterium]
MLSHWKKAGVFAFLILFSLQTWFVYQHYKGSGLSRVPNPQRGEGSILSRAQDANLSALVRSLPAAQSAVPVANLPVTDVLKLYPALEKGMRTPFDLWRYYGKGSSTFSSPILPMRFEQWLEFHEKQKPQLMKDVRAYMGGRFDFSGKVLTHQWMSGGRKPVMAGPIARLPEEIPTFEDLAAMSPETIRAKDIFPYKPLAHPLQTTAHMLFPDSWTAAHPEHKRIDVDMDFPDAYLPEFPPPLFLTTHKELGDISGGQEITFRNYFEIFDGLLTGEQMEGLKELLRPSPTTWFNQTTHRLTLAPSDGVACLDCHTNGHTNGAIELGPDSRPNMARLRVDTPTLRGNYNLLQLSSKRSIRSLDHFSEVEEYFDGDPGMQQAIGPRAVKREVSNRMADFNAIIDYPPAPKLSPLMKLIPSLASEQELRGEKLFHGKAPNAPSATTVPPLSMTTSTTSVSSGFTSGDQKAQSKPSLCAASRIPLPTSMMAERPHSMIQSNFSISSSNSTSIEQKKMIWLPFSSVYNF